MSRRKVEQPIQPTERFSVRTFGARAHQIAAGDKQNWRTFGGEGGSSGECKVLVQKFKPLTPVGAKLAAGGVPKPEKFLRGF